ncbi:MAG: DUF6763 family protein [Steroidobacteraceae bacterium]
MSAQPDVGEWYRVLGGELLEIVAIDEADGTVEVQYFDGTLEEFDLSDWVSQRKDGDIQRAEAPEDWSGSVDAEDDEDMGSGSHAINGDLPIAGGLDGLDLFDAPDLIY